MFEGLKHAAVFDHSAVIPMQRRLTQIQHVARSRGNQRPAKDPGVRVTAAIQLSTRIKKRPLPDARAMAALLLQRFLKRINKAAQLVRA